SDTTKATIQSGALINQITPGSIPGWNPGNDQSVSVTAETAMQFAEMAGIGKWSLSDSPFGKIYAEGANRVTRNDFVDLFGRSGSKAPGGSVLYDEINNTVYARIEGSAKVGTGSAGGLTVTATEDVFRVALGQAGGATDDKGSFAFAGSGVVLKQTSDIE